MGPDPVSSGGDNYARQNYDASCANDDAMLEVVIIYTINMNYLRIVKQLIRNAVTFDVMLAYHTVLQIIIEDITLFEQVMAAENISHRLTEDDWR